MSFKIAIYHLLMHRKKQPVKKCRDKDKNVQKQDILLRLSLLCNTEINT